MSLRVSDLTISRGGLRVLEHVSFAVGPGEALLLRGPNGIGKTTLLRTIAGLQPALAGNVEASPDDIAYAGHADGNKAALSVAENLSLWSRIFGQDTIEPAIAAFGLDQLKDRPAGQLSAGQKRRLGLARLLVIGRRIWLLDEPTVALDKDAVALFVDVVSGHLRNGGSAVIATHIDIGLKDSKALDVSEFRARAAVDKSFDEAFL